MTLIKCPRCGQRVLSVASTCPKCSYVLLEGSIETRDPTALVACPRCRRHIPPDSKRCLYCGHPRRLLQALRLTAAGLIGGVLIATAVVTLITRAAPAPRTAGASPDPRDPVIEVGPSVTAQEPPPAESTAPPVAQSAAVAESVRRQEPPVPMAPPTRAGPPLPPPARESAPEPSVSRSGRQIRWINTWANVREERGTASRMVTVLRPGTRVEVTDRREGWWAVYRDGEFLGYVSGAVLAAAPPPRDSL